MTDTNPSDLLPLPVSQLHILMALATGDKHGYAIMREVQGFTDGMVTMGPGTLYGAVKQMLRAGLIAESDERPDPELDDQRRRDTPRRRPPPERLKCSPKGCTARCSWSIRGSIGGSTGS